jgi:hypothetical protein
VLCSTDNDRIRVYHTPSSLTTIVVKRAEDGTDRDAIKSWVLNPIVLERDWRTKGF